MLKQLEWWRDGEDGTPVTKSQRHLLLQKLSAGHLHIPPMNKEELHANSHNVSSHANFVTLPLDDPWFVACEGQASVDFYDDQVI